MKSVENENYSSRTNKAEKWKYEINNEEACRKKIERQRKLNDSDSLSYKLHVRTHIEISALSHARFN
jgi:hypothetical protein